MEEVNPLQTVENNEEDTTQKSKSQIKKEKRKQKWMEDKVKRKQIQKLKKKEKKEQRRQEKEAGIFKPDNLGKRQNNPYDAEAMMTQKMIKTEYRRLLNEGQPIIIDCSFQDWLSEKELISLCRQIGYCHASNKKLPIPAKIIVTSYNDKLKKQLSKMGADNWGIVLLEKHYLDYYPKDKLVYLTGDATEDVDVLQKDVAYIIGGLVDHNRYKFATLNQASKEELAVKRLPISQNIKLKSSTILSVNHVFDILLKVCNNQGWSDAINNSIPSRKREGEGGEEEKKDEEGNDEERGEESSDSDIINPEDEGDDSDENENSKEAGLKDEKGSNTENKNNPTENNLAQETVITSDNGNKATNEEGNVQ